MANIDDTEELREIVEAIALLRKYPKESVNFMAEHLDEMLSGGAKGVIVDTFDHILPIEGKKVLEDGMVPKL